MKLKLFISAMLIIGSCIGEKTERCPYWGMYRVVFYHNSEEIYSTWQNVTIAVAPESKCVQLYHYKSSTTDKTLTPSAPAMLAPGLYRIYAIYTGDSIQQNSEIVLRNGYRYLYAQTSASVEKRVANDVMLNFNLANSLITANFILNPNFDPNYRLLSAAISPPEDNDIIFNIENGICNYSKRFSPYFEEMLTDTGNNHRYYYCLPVAEGNRIRFRVTLYNPYSADTIILETHINNSTAINQGMVYSYTFNITPFSLESVGSTVTDWREFTFGREIIFN